MRHYFGLFIGSTLCLIGLGLWFIAHKFKIESNCSHLHTVFMGNHLLLFGLYYLVASGWVRGGRDVAQWLVFGATASAIVTMYILFLNRRDRQKIRLQAKLQPVHEAEKLPNL